MELLLSILTNIWLLISLASLFVSINYWLRRGKTSNSGRMLNVTKLTFLFIWITISMLAVLWHSTNEFYIYKVRQYQLSSGQDISSVIKNKYGTQSNEVRLRWNAEHDDWFFNSTITCSISNKYRERLALLIWESEGFEIRAATNRTREITPELAPTHDTAAIAYDQKFYPF